MVEMENSLQLPRPLLQVPTGLPACWNGLAINSPITNADQRYPAKIDLATSGSCLPHHFPGGQFHKLGEANHSFAVART